MLVHETPHNGLLVPQVFKENVRVYNDHIHEKHISRKGKNEATIVCYIFQLQHNPYMRAVRALQCYDR